MDLPSTPTIGYALSTKIVASMDDVRQQLLEMGLCAEATVQGHTLNTEKGKVFVKFGTGGVRTDTPILQYEAMGLEHLAAAAKTIRVPKPWHVGEAKGRGAYIAMDYLPLGGGANIQSDLGKGLAEIHLAEPRHKAFGFPVDGVCGSCPQYNNTEACQMTWPEFWQEYRLGPQLLVLRENQPTDTLIQAKGARLLKGVPELFSVLVVEDISPSLLHGDLWSGNYSSDEWGRPVIFDPAAYYGHDEADLGIARMFGGFTNAFWASYHARIPKRPGHEQRAILYELHHHLNHYNMFGSGYRAGSLARIDQLLQGIHC